GRRVDARYRGCHQVAVAPTRAEADDADPAVMVDEGSQVLHRALDVPDHLVVRYAASRPRRGRDVVPAPRAESTIQMGRDRREAVVRQLTRHLLGPGVPTGRVV